VAHLRRFEGSSWSRIYVVAVYKLLRRYDIYSLFRCFSYIRYAGYGEEFKDVGDGRTSLSRGIFKWLVSIRLSHLVYRSGDTCYLEPYIPSRLLTLQKDRTFTSIFNRPERHLTYRHLQKISEDKLTTGDKITIWTLLIQ